MSQIPPVPYPLDWGKPVRGLAVSIGTAENVWTSPNSTLVGVGFKNFSEEDFNLSLSGAFQLERVPSSVESPNRDDELRKDRYWCPFNFLKPSESPLPYDLQNLELKAGEHKIVLVRLDRLNWEKVISSNWPYQTLFHAVPVGEYLLSFRLEIPSGKNVLVGSTEVPTVDEVVSKKIKVTLNPPDQP
jgi:hypothetical protein